MEVGQVIALIKSFTRSLKTEITNCSNNVDSMRTATSFDANKALSPKTIVNGKVTEWQFKTISGGGGGGGDTVTGDQISGDPIYEETANLLGEFTDGKYATGKSSTATYDGLSYATAEIGDYEFIIVSSFTTPSNTSGYPFVFFNDSSRTWIGSAEYETVATKTYKVPVPEGAKYIHTNVLTADKASAVCKGVAVSQKALDWLTLESENLSQEFIETLKESIEDNLTVYPQAIAAEKTLYGGNVPSDIATESGYYTMKSKGTTPTFTNQYTHFAFTVKPNEIIQTYIGSNVDVISSGDQNGFFCMVDIDGNCVSPIEMSIDANYVYTLRAPEDSHTCYITKTGNSAWAKSYFDEFELGWLVLNSGNCKPHTIPESAIDRNYGHGDSIERPFDFNGASVLAFGDSITAGVANEGSGNISAGENSYIRKFCSKVNATLTNKAEGGATIAYRDNEAVNSVYAQVLATTSAADFIIISGGTNDYNQGITVGTYGDTSEYTTYGALHLICEYLKTQYPNATVIFITPINITKKFNEIPMEKLNDYRKAIYEVATSYGYNVVNGIDLVPVEKQSGWDAEFIHPSDGCHPTLKGHAMYFRNLCMKLL